MQSVFWICPQTRFIFMQWDGEMCLFARVPWRHSLWLDVVYGCSAVCVCRGGHLEEDCTILMLSVWNITALSLDCCVRSVSPIHKNAIPCRSAPGLTKLTTIHQRRRFKTQRGTDAATACRRSRTTIYLWKTDSTQVSQNISLQNLMAVM